MSRQQGVALVLVLWVLSLLTIMAGSFALSMRRETAMIGGLKHTAEAQAVAESGLALAEFMLLNPNVNKRWRADGSIYQIDAPPAKLRIRLLSETGKININIVEQPLLQKLMSHAPNGGEVKLPFATINRAAALLDWRDNDDLVRINGAEKNQYQAAGLNYAPRNQIFQTLEELPMVLGMDKVTLKWLEPLITVYSEQSELDLQLASKEVLNVMLGTQTDLVDHYVTARAESARQNFPAPPLPTGVVSSVTPEVTALTIIAEVQFDDQSTAVINALVKKSDETQTTPFQVVRWQSAANTGSLFADNMNELVVKHYAESELNH